MSKPLDTQEPRKELKAKLRRAAAYLQGGETRYFSDPALLEAIYTLYRLADTFTEAKR